MPTITISELKPVKLDIIVTKTGREKWIFNKTENVEEAGIYRNGKKIGNWGDMMRIGEP